MTAACPGKGAYVSRSSTQRRTTWVICIEWTHDFTCYYSLKILVFLSIEIKMGFIDLLVSTDNFVGIIYTIFSIVTAISMTT